MDVKVLGSMCATSDVYLEVVEQILKKMNIKYTIEKIIDPEIMKKYDVSIGCLYGYCPGCNTVNEDNKDDKYTPALVIDGQLMLHSCFPEDSVFEEIIKKVKNLI